jgi:hypothetical protein
MIPGAARLSPHPRRVKPHPHESRSRQRPGRSDCLPPLTFRRASKRLAPSTPLPELRRPVLATRPCTPTPCHPSPLLVVASVSEGATHPDTRLRFERVGPISSGPLSPLRASASTSTASVLHHGAVSALRALRRTRPGALAPTRTTTALPPEAESNKGPSRWGRRSAGNSRPFTRARMRARGSGTCGFRLTAAGIITEAGLSGVRGGDVFEGDRGAGSLDAETQFECCRHFAVRHRSGTCARLLHELREPRRVTMRNPMVAPVQMGGTCQCANQVMLRAERLRLG